MDGVATCRVADDDGARMDDEWFRSGDIEVDFGLSVAALLVVAVLFTDGLSVAVLCLIWDIVSILLRLAVLDGAVVDGVGKGTVDVGVEIIDLVEVHHSTIPEDQNKAASSTDSPDCMGSSCTLRQASISTVEGPL